jgi:hypothetical protein
MSTPKHRHRSPSDAITVVKPAQVVEALAELVNGRFKEDE